MELLHMYNICYIIYLVEMRNNNIDVTLLLVGVY